MEGIRLFDLANLAIGTPKPGAVNFPAMHTLLHAILKHLNIQDARTELPEGGARWEPPSGGVKTEEKEQENSMERRVLHLEEQLEALNKLPSALELIERSKCGQQGGSGAVADMWQMMTLRRRMEVNEEGVCKAMAVLQDLMTEMNTMKEAQSKDAQTLYSAAPGSPVETPALPPEATSKELTSMDAAGAPGSSGETPALLPGATSEELTSMDAAGAPGSSKETPALPPVATPEELTSMDVAGAPGSSKETPALPPGAASEELTSMDAAGAPGSSKETPALPPGATSKELTSMDAAGASASPGETPALPPGAASEELAMLYSRVDALERDKADRTELDILQRNTDDLAKTIPDLQEKFTSLNKEIRRGDGEEKATDPMVTHQNDQRGEDTNQITQQLGKLSAAIQDMEKELKQLRERQVTMAQSMADKIQLQAQLDTLRGIITAMASSSSTLLAMSIPGQSDSSTPGSIVTAETTCPACTIDIGKKVSKLVSQYEDLQNLVTDYTSGEANGKDLGAGRKASDPHIKDTDIVGYIKTTMGHLQKECENLNETTKTLIQDHELKHKHIETLYREVGKLENKKADKELIGLEIGVKADKQALERKVSCSRFDVTTEYLGKMIEDLLEKVDAHQKDWQNLVGKINVEMQNKLDRMEIDPLKNILEERWKDLCRQLQEHPPQYEADEAVGIRKQLMTRFHCLSCDRPVDMKVPGWEILTLPKLSGLPATQSTRPYTVYELDRCRQQSHRLKSGIHRARREASQLEMSINHLRSIHTHMRQEISRVQLHFGGSEKTSGKICHILPAHCATLQKFSRRSSSNQKLSRLSELDRSRYMTVPRNCGGSHTLTFAQRNYAKVSTPCTLQKKTATGVGQKERPRG